MRKITVGTKLKSDTGQWLVTSITCKYSDLANMWMTHLKMINLYTGEVAVLPLQKIDLEKTEFESTDLNV